MKTPLNILHLEDDTEDAALVLSKLTTGGVACAITVVENREDFVAALEHGDIDLVLSDYTLPAFDGLSATKIVRERWPHVPVILVSGTLGEELAIESLKNGATDYVLKDRLHRLVPAVQRALKEVGDKAERGRLEAQIVEAQKMEIVGQLASGVAHDFNNFVAIIMGYSELVMQKLSPNSGLQHYLEIMRSAAERAAGLTQQLLIFSRKQTVNPVVLDLNKVVKEMDKMLRRLLGVQIEMKLVLGNHTGFVRADSGYVGQVLMNLVVNARDAMPAGGKITIATQFATLDENYAQSHPGVLPGDYVMLSVSDTGTGIAEDVKARLFEAFFTTKPSGKGTGLGLATCQTILQQSGGHICFYTELGVGTTFKAYFPRVELPESDTAIRRRRKKLPRGTETLLIVDDNPAVEQLARGILEAQGYEVLSASNGREGLRVARAHKGAPIRLVVTDVVMPHMGGSAMAARFMASHPSLKILFTSGYTHDAIASHGVLEKGVEFLAKPYTPATLACKVRQILDRVKPPEPEDVASSLRLSIS